MMNLMQNNYFGYVYGEYIDEIISECNLAKNLDIVKDRDIENLESLGEVSEVKKFKQTLHGEVISFIRPILLKLDW